MEEANLPLDKDDPAHIWLLHFLFLEDINAELEIYRNMRNRRRLPNSPRNVNRPFQIFNAGQLEHGVRGLWDEVDTEEYGTEYSAQERDRMVQQMSESEVRNEVTVNDPRCPFEDELEGRQQMLEVMGSVWSSDWVERWEAGLEAMTALLGNQHRL